MDRNNYETVVPAEGEARIKQEDEMYEDYLNIIQMWIDYFLFYEEDGLAEKAARYLTPVQERGNEDMYGFAIKRIFLTEMLFWQNIYDADIQRGGILYIKAREKFERKWRSFKKEDIGFFEMNWYLWV